MVPLFKSVGYQLIYHTFTEKCELSNSNLIELRPSTVFFWRQLELQTPPPQDVQISRLQLCVLHIYRYAKCTLNSLIDITTRLLTRGLAVNQIIQICIPCAVYLQYPRLMYDITITYKYILKNR